MIAECCSSIKNMGLISCNLITTDAVLHLLKSRRASLMNVGVLDCPLVDSMQIISQLTTLVPFINKVSISPPKYDAVPAIVKALYRTGTITFGVHFDPKLMQDDASKA
jgi:hypothetical protein